MPEIITHNRSFKISCILSATKQDEMITFVMDIYIHTVRVSVVCVCTFLCMCLGIRCGAHVGSSEDSLGYLSSCIALVLTVTYASILFGL